MTNIPGKIAFYIVPASCNCLSESILLRCTKYSLEIELRELSPPVPHGQSEQFSLKSMKEIYIPAKVINPCQFITDPLKSPKMRTVCVRQWFRTAEPLGERHYENWNTHTHPQELLSTC